ncbi:MAG TPA: hypothetical protein VHV83_15310, partial [Armatimonadota bacterium]|nr:hypothetical protein [Armatimonadota bacterium]
MDASVWHGVFWNHLIYPELSYDEVEDPELTVAWVHEQLMHGAFPHYVVCICLDEYSYLSLAERRESVSLVKRVIQRHISPQACQLLGFAHGNSVYFCGMLDDPDSATSRDAFIKCLERLRDEIAVVNAISATIGIAFLASSSIEAWRWAAQRAIVAQRSKVRLGASRVYVYDSAAHNACISHDSYWYLAQELYTLVRSGDIDQVDRVLGNTIKHFF